MSEKDFEILLYELTYKTVRLIMDINNWNEDLAFSEFVKSDTYSNLENPESGFLKHSPIKLAQLFKNEEKLPSVSECEDLNKILDFKVFCFESYRSEKKYSGKYTMELFEKYGVLEYLSKFYDVLHTTGREYMIEEIDMFIEKRVQSSTS